MEPPALVADPTGTGAMAPDVPLEDGPLAAEIGEIAGVLSRVDVKALGESQRRAIAGCFAQALSGAQSEEFYQWALSFFADLCVDKLHLPQSAASGFTPMLGSPPAYRVSLPGASVGAGEPPLTGLTNRDAAYHCPAHLRHSATSHGTQSPFLFQLSPNPKEREDILLVLMMAYIACGTYDARTREAFRRAASIFWLEWRRVAVYEDAFVSHIAQQVQHTELASTAGRRRQASARSRWLKIGLAAVAGAGLLVATGGLAAPALLGGIATLGATVGLGGTAAAAVAFFSSSAGATLLLAIFGVSGGSLASYRMARRTAGVETFLFVDLRSEARPSADAEGAGETAPPALAAPAMSATDGVPGGVKGSARAVVLTPRRDSKSTLGASPSVVGAASTSGDATQAAAAAAAAVVGGLHVFIVCSGMVVDATRVPPTGLMSEFITPWGGHLHAHTEDQRAGTGSTAAGPPGTHAATSGMIAGRSGSERPVLVRRNSVASVPVPELPVAATAPQPCQSLYQTSLKGRYCILRPAGVGDRPTLVDWCTHGEGSANVTFWEQAMCPSPDAGSSMSLPGSTESGVNLGDMSVLWPFELFDLTAATSGRAYIISIPVSVVRTSTTGATSAAPSSPSTELTFIDVGFVSYHRQGTRSGSEREEVALRFMIAQERYHGCGLGTDALTTLLLHLCAETASPAALAPTYNTIDEAPTSLTTAASSATGIAAPSCTFVCMIPQQCTQAMSVVSTLGFTARQVAVAPGHLSYVLMLATPAEVVPAVQTHPARLAAGVSQTTTDSSSPLGDPAAHSGSPSLAVDHAAVCCDQCGQTGGGHTPSCPHALALAGVVASQYSDGYILLRVDPSTFKLNPHLDILFESEGEGASTPARRGSDVTPTQTNWNVKSAATLTESLSSTLVQTAKRASTLGAVGIGKMASRDQWLHRMLPYGDKFSLVYEPEKLKAVGDNTTLFVQQYLSSQAVSSLLAHTALATVLSAWTWPSYVVSALSFIDSPWALVVDRCDKTGRLLADALLAGAHGSRPVTLVGYGLGARVVFVAARHIARAAAQVQGEIADRLAHASQSRSRVPAFMHHHSQDAHVEPPWMYRTRKQALDAPAASGSSAPPASTTGTGTVATATGGAGSGVDGSGGASAGTASGALTDSHVPTQYYISPSVNPFALLQDVVLLGAPVAAGLSDWRAIRRVASGRIINGYCTGDFVLRFVFRSRTLSWNIAGLAPVGAAPPAPVVPEPKVDTAVSAPVKCATSSSAPDSGTTPSVPATAAASSSSTSSVDAPTHSTAAAVPSNARSTGTSTRGSSFTRSSAGPQPDNAPPWHPHPPPCASATMWFEGIENVDLGCIVKGHLDYRNQLEHIMHFIDLEASV